jgi:ribosomal protein RSM22 (predicted rRNA methylase)
VQLPDPVKRRIEEHAEAVGYAALARAAAEMSEAYRAGRPVRMESAETLAAYLVTRMPATYTAAHAVLGEVRRRLGERVVATALDIGAGTGAASLAVRHWFPEAHVTLIERDAGMAALAREWLPDSNVVSRDVARMEPFPPHDLVIAAYSLGEIGAAAGERMWRAAQVAMVTIEPGTPRGFGLIRALRGELLSAGAHMLAPCPAAIECPMAGGDWCHFAARVERSSLHRKVKGGALGHEDEKYSYVALSRKEVVLPEARIIRHPQHHPGLVVLEVCTAKGLRQQAVRKREREQFREARQASWGDAIAGI